MTTQSACSTTASHPPAPNYAGAVAKLFAELHVLIQHRSEPGESSPITPTSLDAQQFQAHCTDGRSSAEALFLIIQHADTALGKALFGEVRPSFDAQTQILAVTHTDCKFQLVLGQPNGPPTSAILSGTTTVTLCTDFESFSFWRFQGTNSGPGTPFAVFTGPEMSQEVAFSGSALATVFPAHYAVLTRTISYTFPAGGPAPIFSASRRSAEHQLDFERVAKRALKCFNAPNYRQLSLNELCVAMQGQPKAPRLLSEQREGEYILRRYSPQRSSIFDFGEPTGELSRGDFVTTYHDSRSEFHRDYFLSPATWSPADNEIRLAAFDILHLLAIRRAKLFRPGFARRVYNILFPPLLLTRERLSSGLVIFPCLNLYRPVRGEFRRTVSLTFIVCPVDVGDPVRRTDSVLARRMSLLELFRVKDELMVPVADELLVQSFDHYRIRDVCGAYYRVQEAWPLPLMLRHISKSILQCVAGGESACNGATGDLLESILFAGTHDSKIASISLQVEWTPPEGFTQPWERWLATGQDRVFQNVLFRTLFYRDFLDPRCADVSRHAVQFREYNVGNTLGADMSGMTLYNPQDSLKLVLYPKASERYPNHSMLRWMAWQVYIDSALTSLRSLIFKFHPVLEDRKDLHTIIDTLDDIITEFVDFYDLDIRDFFYRKEYEKLRGLMQVDADYARLLAKYASNKDNESLREQRLINKLVVAFAIATATITIVSTIAQLGVLRPANYLVIALASSTVLVWIGYVVFDPLRHGHRQLRQQAKEFLKSFRKMLREIYERF